MFDILLPAWLTGILLAFVTAPLGAFVLWRKMAYFGDTLAHSALLGVALGFFLQINPYFAIIGVTLFIAIALVLLERKTHFSVDALLGIIAHSCLSFGVVVISLMNNVRVDLMSYLFGDLLALAYDDLIWISLTVVGILCVLIYFWNTLLSITISPDLAKVEGVNVDFIRLVLMLLTALTIALCMKFVGALIITALLIIPGATARRFAQSPEQMVVWSSLFTIIAVSLGLLFSAFYNTPAGPSVVLGSTLLFLCSLAKKNNQ